MMLSNESHAARWVLGLFAVGVISCGGATDVRSTNGESPPDQSTGRDVLAVALGTEVRLIRLDGSQRSILAGDFFSGVTGVDLVGDGQFVVVRSYAQHS